MERIIESKKKLISFVLTLALVLGAVFVPGTGVVKEAYADEIECNFSYDANGATGDAPASHDYATAKQAKDINTLNKSGFVFNGWDTNASGDGTRVAPGDPLMYLASGKSQVTLYAIWAPEDKLISEAAFSVFPHIANRVGSGFKVDETVEIATNNAFTVHHFVTSTDCLYAVYLLTPEDGYQFAFDTSEWQNRVLFDGSINEQTEAFFVGYESEIKEGLIENMGVDEAYFASQGSILVQIKIYESFGKNNSYTGGSILSGNYGLQGDIVLETDMAIDVDEEVNLCLCDHVIDLNGHHIVVNGELNIYDCGTTPKYFTTNTDLMWVYSATPTDLYVTGGVITSGSGVNGGAVDVAGTFGLYGGNIVGNKIAQTGGGGGVHVGNTGTFIMEGGSIVGNHSVYQSQSAGVHNQGSFIMNGGCICYNSSFQDGAVINFGNMTVGGIAKIVNNVNTSNYQSNIFYINSVDKTFGISDTNPLLDGACIYVSCLSVGKFIFLAEGLFATNATATDRQFFRSDNLGYKVVCSGDALWLVEFTGSTLYYSSNGAVSGTVATDANSYMNTSVASIQGNTGNLARPGYEFLGWGTDPAVSTTVSSVTFEEEDITVYAIWYEIPTYTLTYDANGADSGTVPTDETKYYSTSSASLAANTGNLTKSGYEFVGWSTGSSVTTTVSSVTFEEDDITVYAVWKEIEQQQPSGGVVYYDPTPQKEFWEVCKKDFKCPITDYVDSDRYSWYHDGLHYCLDKGYVDGEDETHFNPSDKLTRAMMVTLLYNVEKKPIVTSDSTFTDVKSGLWYSIPISWGQKYHVVDGTGKGTFEPNVKITREMLATLLFNYAKLKGYDVEGRESLGKFSDTASVSSWAKDAIEWAVANKIISGKDNGTLDPKGLATRAEAAVLIQQFLVKFGK